METSASFEARSAPSSYPTGNAARTVLCGGRSAMVVPTATTKGYWDAGADSLLKGFINSQLNFVVV